MDRQEIVFGGFGGQGIILAGNIAAQAASIYDGRNATLTQDYGPEARGGSCRVQVVVSDSPISYPYIDHPSVLVVMSQEAYTKYVPALRPDGLLIIDEALVKPDKSAHKQMLTVAATGIAQELGRAAVANIVMLGFFTAATGLISVAAMKKSVLESVPRGTEELNSKAFERGYARGRAKGGNNPCSLK